jgi:hypothetical protein
MSEKLISRQIEFIANLMGSGEEDLTKTCAINHNGSRVSAGHKRIGRPRIKCYDQVIEACLQRLVSLGVLLPDWSEYIRTEDAIHMVHTAAMEREL